MTKQEQARMNRLERENLHLRERLEKAMEIYGAHVFELVDLKARLETIEIAVRGEE